MNPIIIRQLVAQVTTRQQEKKKTPLPGDAFMQQMKQELQNDAWFGAHTGELMLREELAWKGSKLNVPDSL